MNDEELIINSPESEDEPIIQKDVLSGTPPKGLPRIRTYAADMSEAMRERGTTLATIVAAEKDKPQPATPAPRQRRTLLLVIGASLLVILSIGAITTAVILSNKKNTLPTPITTVIPANASASVALSIDTPLPTLLAAHRGDSLALGTIERLDVSSGKMLVGAADLARDIGVPDIIARSVTGAMVGIHSFDRNQPFIILRGIAYDRAFGAALQWEPTMGKNLGAFFAPLDATSTAPTLTFTDMIVNNVDVRQSQGSWPILYAFPARDTMIITTNQFTLKEVLSRLGSVQQ